jgi:hypothetical protein
LKLRIANRRARIDVSSSMFEPDKLDSSRLVMETARYRSAEAYENGARQIINLKSLQL